MTEAELLYEIRLALGRQPDLVLWRNSTGSAEYGAGSLVGLHGRRLRHPRRVRYGLAPGSSDLVGIYTVNGRGLALFVEVKSPTGKVSRAQALFRDLVLRRGGVYILARSVEDVMAGLRDAAVRHA